MVHATVMVRTESGTAADVREEVSRMESVVDAHVVAGDFDLVAEVDCEDVYDVLQTASSEVQTTAGVTETKTYVSLA